MQNYFYDLHDQLVKAEIFKKDGTKETWAYTYDALGRRIGKGRLKHEEVSDGLEKETGFVWDGSHLLQEVHPDGRYTYIYTDPDSYEPLAQVHNRTNEDGESGQQTHYFHCDQIGIPREMTDKDGLLLWFGNYTGWGRLKNETNVTGTTHQPFRLQNQYCDHETGLHYNFFRYYEPDAGRFVNQDPIGLWGGENLYQFALNTQIWIDPLGLTCDCQVGKDARSQDMYKKFEADIQKLVDEHDYRNRLVPPVIPGGVSGAIIHEKTTGTLVGGKSHSQKGKNIRDKLQKIFKKVDNAYSLCPHQKAALHNLGDPVLNALNNALSM